MELLEVLLIDADTLSHLFLGGLNRVLEHQPVPPSVQGAW